MNEIKTSNENHKEQLQCKPLFNSHRLSVRFTTPKPFLCAVSNYTYSIRKEMVQDPIHVRKSVVGRCTNLEHPQHDGKFAHTYTIYDVVHTSCNESRIENMTTTCRFRLPAWPLRHTLSSWGSGA